KEGNANWNSITLEVQVEAEGVEESKFKQFASETERRCPVTQLFKRSGVEWQSRWENAEK
ncbi:UNVERIFIED_CONTAM: OsmC family peroxiredoxin, partial [Bacteroidetes bacterium 56_B9]